VRGGAGDSILTMEKERKTCYYEVLAVDMAATDEELNKAYKKGALKWHPDRNMHQQDIATVKFKELRNAFETLSDPNERAWYDGHREQILRGGDGTGAGNAEDLDINLYEFMSSSCYDGMGDDEQGFYGVYGEVFDQLAAEERQTPTDDDDDEVAPHFGRSTSAWVEVDLFYSFWSNFVTRRKFGHVDKYNLLQMPDRAHRRAAEKENQKLRTLAKKAANEHVRQLVEYVKRRDPRFKQRQVELAAKKAEREEQKAEEKAALSEQRRQEREQQQREMEEMYREMDAQELNEEPEEGDTAMEAEELYCVVCKKAFKNPKAWASHERSKKHIKAVEQLRRELQAEDLEMEEAQEDEQCGLCADEADAGTSDQAGLSDQAVFEGSAWSWNGSPASGEMMLHPDGRWCFGAPLADVGGSWAIGNASGQLLIDCELNEKVYLMELGEFGDAFTATDQATGDQVASGELVEGTAGTELAEWIEAKQSAFLASVEEEEAGGKVVEPEEEAASDRESENVEEEQAEEDEEDPMYCKVCRKAFKSTKQLKAHLKSKKHLKAQAAAEDLIEEPQVSDEQDELTVESEAAAGEAAEAEAGVPAEDGEYCIIGATAAEGNVSAPKAAPKELSHQELKRRAQAEKKNKKSKGKEKDSLKCEVCREVFASRNQMFKHIKQTGHAAFK
jgi:DnaJ family protein A protein 5